ncbi:hypothetical protein M2351_005131 [Azospirillum canadense]|nr:hypothetical protein [Azospirillum canadense]
MKQAPARPPSRGNSSRGLGATAQRGGRAHPMDVHRRACPRENGACLSTAIPLTDHSSLNPS